MDLSICIPTRDHIPAGFAACLANLTSELTRKHVSFSLNMILGTTISDMRNSLVKKAISDNFEYTLWLDSDMHVPSDVFFKLKNHKMNIVACTYSTRAKPARNVAFIDQFDLDKRLTVTNGLHPVFAVGFGCILIKTDVFKNIPKPWFFNRWDAETETVVGEDVVFCENAADAGYTIYVDVDTSKRIGHYGSKIYLLGETHEYCKII
jgi:hypothetical protein